MWLTLVLHRLPPILSRARFFRWTMARALENAFEVAGDARVGADRGGWGRRGGAYRIFRKFHGGIPRCSPSFGMQLQILAVKSALCWGLPPLRLLDTLNSRQLLGRTHLRLHTRKARFQHQKCSWYICATCSAQESAHFGTFSSSLRQRSLP